jgi:hypothetical protein
VYPYAVGNPVENPMPVVIPRPVVTEPELARMDAREGDQESPSVFAGDKAQGGMVRLAVGTVDGRPVGLYVAERAVQFPLHCVWVAHQEGWIAS